MGFWDSLLETAEKCNRRNERNARIYCSNKLHDAYDRTNDEDKKREISRMIKENNDALRNL